MIPDDLRGFIEKQPGNVHRRDRAKAEQALAYLGIPDGEFAQFFHEYAITLFGSDVSDEELVDIAEPTFRINASTRFAQEVWALPERYVCFTTCQGEGGYLYDKGSGSVFDFSLATRDSFVEGRELPRWSGFFEFMRWYLTGE